MRSLPDHYQQWFGQIVIAKWGKGRKSDQKYPGLIVDPFRLPQDYLIRADFSAAYGKVRSNENDEMKSVTHGYYLTISDVVFLLVPQEQ